MTFAEWLQQSRGTFPALDETNCQPTSPFDEGYNCIAWAAGDTKKWWWPDPLEQLYWPPEVPRQQSLDAFVKAFALLGYSARCDASCETDKHKVAIFVNSSQTPTHAARQLANGKWTSKLGQQIDIEHELVAIEGPLYGTVAIILAKDIKTQSNDVAKREREKNHQKRTR